MHFIVKNTTLPGILDLLAPHSCRGCGRMGVPLCDRCKKYLISEHERFEGLGKTASQLPEDWPPTTIVGARDGLMGDLIHDLKYNSVRALGRPLAEILDAVLPLRSTEAPISTHGGRVLTSDVVIVPLPTIRRHVRQRGLDHTLLLARELGQLRGYPVERLLMRQRDTVQVGSSARERAQQARSAYTLAPHAEICPQATYLLLDDVWTTGATMEAAVALLRKAGAKKLQIALLAKS